MYVSLLLNNSLLRVVLGSFSDVNPTLLRLLCFLCIVPPKLFLEGLVIGLSIWKSFVESLILFLALVVFSTSSKSILTLDKPDFSSLLLTATSVWKKLPVEPLSAKSPNLRLPFCPPTATCPSTSCFTTSAWHLHNKHTSYPSLLTSPSYISLESSESKCLELNSLLIIK